MMKLAQLLPIIIWIVNLIHCGGVAIVNDPDITLLPSLKLYVDPPSGHSSPAALGVFARASDPSALVYYTSWDTTKDAGVMYPPSLDSDDSNTVFISEETPYIQLDTPFRATRARTLILVAVVEDDGSLFRSEQLVYNYTIEGSARPYSYGFLVPGIESGGHFVRYGIEIAAKARAQVAGGQEFADFDTNLGIGTYDSQIKTLNLQDIDPELTGFEGGFPGIIAYYYYNYYCSYYYYYYYYYNYYYYYYYYYHYYYFYSLVIQYVIDHLYDYCLNVSYSEYIVRQALRVSGAVSQWRGTYYTIVYYTIVYYTIVYCTILWCTVLYYSVL